MSGCCLISQLCLTFATQWTAACHAPLSMGFPGKNTGVDCRSLLQGNLPDPGVKPMSSALAGRFFTPEPPGKPVWLIGQNY